MLLLACTAPVASEPAPSSSPAISPTGEPSSTSNVLFDGFEVPDSGGHCFIEDMVPDPLLLGTLVALEPVDDERWANDYVSADIATIDEYGNIIGDGLSIRSHVGMNHLSGDLSTYAFPGGTLEIPYGTIKVHVRLCGMDVDKYRFSAQLPDFVPQMPRIWPSLFDGLYLSPSEKACTSDVYRVDPRMWGTSITFSALNKKYRSGWVKVDFVDRYFNLLLSAVDTEGDFASDPSHYRYSGSQATIPMGTFLATIEICGQSYSYHLSVNP